MNARELAASARSKLTAAEQGALITEARLLLRAGVLLEVRDLLTDAGETRAAGIIRDLFDRDASPIDPRVAAEGRP